MKTMDSLTKGVFLFVTILSLGLIPEQTAFAEDPACVAAPTGLISWWPGQTNANDIVGGNNGIITTQFLGEVLFSPGKVGNAFDFRGTNFVEAPPIALGNFTLELWAKQRARGTFHDNFGSTLVTGEVCGAVDDWHTGILPDGRLVVRIDGDGSVASGTVFFSSNVIPLNTFTHIAVTRSTNTSLVAIYLNGVLDSSHVCPNNHVVGASDPTCDTGIHQNRIGIGNVRRSAVLAGNSVAFDGLIDEISIYGRVLSGTEVAAIRAADSGGKCPPPPPPTNCVAAPSGLVSWWRAETNALDYVDGNNGTLAGNTSYAAARVGQGFLFDGNGDAVRLGNPANLNLQNLTIEAWIKRSSSSVVSFGSEGNGVLFSHGSQGYVFYMDAAGRLAFGKGYVDNVTLGTAITDTSFHHIAVTRSGATLAFYIDGVPYPAPAYATVFAATANVAIGAHDDLGNSFNGIIDELGIYNRGLTASEIQALYLAGAGGKCTGPAPPTILSQPQPQTVFVGETAAFSVVAGGSLPLTYQWRLNGTNIPGATTNSFTRLNAQFAHAGNYSVFVSNNIGTATSLDALLTVNPLPPCLAPPGGLVSWWRAEGNGLDQVDGNNGTQAGDASFGPGRVGAGFAFDGNGDAIRVGNPTNLDLQNLTIEAWIKRASSSVVSFGSEGNGVILSHGANGYVFYMDASGRLAFSKGYVDNRVAPTAITDTSWHHVAVTKSGTTVVFYIDGVAFPVSTYGSVFLASANVAIGGHDDLGNSFNGIIDEIAIYNRGLNASEILGIYNALLSGKCVTPPPAPTCTPAGMGLVSWWPLEGNANDVFDANPGTLVGGSNFIPGAVGQALVSGGTNHILVPASANLNVVSFTIEAWVYRADDGTPRPIVEYAAATGRAGVHLWANVNPAAPDGPPLAGALYSSVQDTAAGGHIIGTSAGAMPLNQWTHVALTYDQPSGVARLYANGTNMATVNLGSFTPWTSLPLNIGYRPIGSIHTYAGKRFVGRMDEVSVYNRALSPAEIQLLFYAGSAGKCPPPPPCAPAPTGLVSWWRAENNSVDSVDSNNGTVAGNTSFVLGRFGQGFRFDGNGDAIRLGNPTNLHLQNFTFEGWIKRASAAVVSFGSEGNGVIFSHGANGYVFYMEANGRLSLSKGYVDKVTIGAAITDTNFHHVAVTKSGTTVVFYIDSVAYIVEAYGSVFAASANVAIGGHDDLNNSFNGLIDELAVFDRALSSDEVQGIFRTRSGSICPTPPSILVHPISQKVTVGSNATFNVVAEGTPQLRYQWMRGGSPIAGATNPGFTFQVMPGSGGLYSVRVTNAFGAAPSSNALLTVNFIPEAAPQSVSTPEDTGLPIVLQGSDANTDPLSFAIVQPPMHGMLSGTPPNVTYHPAHDYFGPDGFTFKVNDGLVDSAPALVGIAVMPVNDRPVAHSQHVPVDEDTPKAITLGAFDADGDALTYTVGSPAHGGLTGTPPNLTYHPNSNYFGPDSFTFMVSDGQTSSAPATVSITVLSMNDAPVARIIVTPLADLPGVTNKVVITPVCADARVVLDGSQSSDVEHAPLEFEWLEGTNVLATTATSTNELPVGTHVITLNVSDGAATGTAAVTLEVVSPAQAVAVLIELVNSSDLGQRNPMALLATLRAAAAAFESCEPTPGTKQLQAFQNKVRAQIAPFDPALAAQLIQGAQEIISFAEGNGSAAGGREARSEEGKPWSSGRP